MNRVNSVKSFSQQKKRAVGGGSNIQNEPDQAPRKWIDSDELEALRSFVSSGRVWNGTTETRGPHGALTPTLSLANDPEPLGDLRAACAAAYEFCCEELENREASMEDGAGRLAARKIVKKLAAALGGTSPSALGDPLLDAVKPPLNR